MKSVGTILSILLLSCACVLAHPTSDDSFVEACKTAWESGQIEKLNELTYTEGATEADKERLAKNRATGMSGTKIKAATLLPVPEDFQSVTIGKGMKWEPTHTPTGFLKLELLREGKESGAVSIAYTIIDRKYYLVGTKSTDLKWTGPPDVLLTYELTSPVATEVEVEYSWNASGVDQTRKIKFPVKGFVGNSTQGQHINWIRVTAKSPDSTLTLSLSKDTKEYFKSQPLIGVGIIEYKKPN